MPNPTSPYGRQQVEWPDLAADGGATLHSQVVGGIGYFSDQVNRIWADTQTVADGASITIDHNFDFGSVDTVRVRIWDTAQVIPEVGQIVEQASWVVAYPNANQVTITNNTGSSKDIQVYLEPIIHLRENDLESFYTTSLVKKANGIFTINYIRVNYDGNDASAEGGGINLIGTGNAVLATLAYDSALASKWKIGAVGTEKQIVTVSDVQVITEKDIDGGTASNTRRLTVPKNTKANLVALTRKVATLAYATDENKLYADDGSSLIEVGNDLTNIGVDIQPTTDGSQSLGTATKSWNVLWLKDTVTGDTYRLEVANGVLQAVFVP